MKKNYEKPEIEIIEILVEKGFLVSQPGGELGGGEDENE